MKKALCILLAFVVLTALAACGGTSPDREPGDGPAIENAAPEVGIDLGESAIYTQEDLRAAVLAIREEFAAFEGCELHRLRYAGDESCTEENLHWMNELNPDGGYTQVAEFLSDFRSPAEETGAWEADREYTDWQWWLARTENGGWEILTWGY